MVVEVVCALLGLVLLGLVQFDIVATVLHPEIESPLSNRFHRLGWQLLRTASRFVPDPKRRHALLSWSLPLLVAGLITLWLFLLLVAFALIYYPWIGDPTHFTTPDGGGRSAIEALYYSGVTLFTIGYGEFQPVSRPFRTLAVLEAVSGILAISLSVAYLLAVYPAVSRRRAIAVALDAEVAGQVDTLPMVRRYLTEDGGNVAELATRLRELGLELLSVTEVHETHPVLYYAHPRQVQHSVLRILITAQNLVGLLRYSLSPDRHGPVVRNPQLLLLEQSLHYSLRRLSASLHIGGVERIEDRGKREELVEEYRRRCAALEQLGLVSARRLATAPVPVLVDSEVSGDEAPASSPAPPPSGLLTYSGEPEVLDPALDLSSDSAVEAYVMFRMESDPHIAAYANACGYTLDEARCDYGTTWWVSNR